MDSVLEFKFIDVFYYFEFGGVDKGYQKAKNEQHDKIYQKTA